MGDRKIEPTCNINSIESIRVLQEMGVDGHEHSHGLLFAGLDLLLRDLGPVLGIVLARALAHASLASCKTRKTTINS